MPATESTTSVSLLVRVRAYDPEAWRRLSDVYAPIVYGWCRRHGLQESDAADVCQEVFHAVARNIEGFRRDRPEDSFRGWLWTITRNKVRDLGRAGANEATAIGGPAGHERLANVPAPLAEDDPAASASTVAIAHRAIALVRDEFESSTWEAFRRVTMDGRRPVDVADELGMTLGAVCTAKWRVLKRLRSEMEGLW